MVRKMILLCLAILTSIRVCAYDFSAKIDVTIDMATLSQITKENEDIVIWFADPITVMNEKATSSYKANNLIGGKGTYTKTTIYPGQVFSIATLNTLQIDSVEITVPAAYNKSAWTSAWKNAKSVKASPNPELTVMVVPQYPDLPLVACTDVSLNLSGMKVYYSDFTGVHTPVFTPNSGSFYDAQYITITAGEGTRIKYSVNGGDFVEYTEPIKVLGTSTILAYAVDAEGYESATNTATFTIHPHYTSLAELIALGIPSSTGTPLTVDVDAEISKIEDYSGWSDWYVKVKCGEKNVVLYKNGSKPENWEVGGTVSGNVKGIWKSSQYGDYTLQLTATEWSDLTARAYDFSAVNSDGKTVYYDITSNTTCEVTYGGTSFSSVLYSGIVNIPASVINEKDGKIYSVTSIGDKAFFGCTGLTSITIPNTVMSIGEQAFNNCSGLASVTIGNSVTSIGESAFYKCSGLTAVNITDLDKWAEIEFGSYDANPLCYAKNLYLNGKLVTDAKLTSATKIGSRAFYGCTGLTSVTIPNSVTSIGSTAFYGCSGLTSIEIPNSVTSIGGSAFYYCTGLTSVTIGNSVESIGSNAFYGCSNVKELIYAEGTKLVLRTWLTSITSVTIPNSVTSIGSSAFSGCSGLTSVTIGNSVRSIGSNAFYGCSVLTSIVIPNLVTSIGQSAFYGCSVLTEVTLKSDAVVNKTYTSGSNLKTIFGAQVLKYIVGNEVKGVGDYAFYNCTKLQGVEIGNSVETIGDYAFYGCSDLESIVLPDVLNKIGNYAFAKTSLTSIDVPNSATSIGDCAFFNCKVLSDVNVGISVTKVGESAFSGCMCLESIHIPHGVTGIAARTFYKCSSLKDVSMPSSVTSIGTSAFYGCACLDSIVIPNEVATIRDSVFFDCNALKNVYVCWNKPITVSKNVFSYMYAYMTTLWVPIGRKNFYKVDDVWGKFFEIKEWDPSTGIEEIGLSPALSTREGATYNLQGVKVGGKPYRGIVIKNGRKYLKR